MFYPKNLLTVTKVFLALGTVCATGLSVISSANASTFTTTSLTSKGELDEGISEVGGIVLDLVGANDARVTSQLAASNLFEGFASNNPLTIGTQTGFDSSVIDALGGGLKEVAVRFTLDDGDTALGDFDFNDNTLLLNGIDFGNWSDVNAENTDAMGNTDSDGFSGGGFRNNRLDTGWFFSNNSATLGSFFSTLTSQQQVAYELDDVDPGENFFDFTKGIDSSLINIGQGPTVEPPEPPVTPPTPPTPPTPTPDTATTPEPASILGLFALGAVGTLKRKKSS